MCMYYFDKVEFKNLKIHLVIITWKIHYSHVLISLMVFLEGTQSFFSDFKLSKLEVSRGTKSNVEEDLEAEEE